MKLRWEWQEIRARFTSIGGCGHTIIKDDLIGYARAGQRTRCEVCWRIMKEKKAARRQEQMMEAMRV